MEKEEYILPMHRNLGVFTTRAIPLYRLFAQWQGKASGFTNGRDRSFHFGTQEFNIIGMISHLGPQLGVADGIALANVLKKQKHVTAVFTGEGGTSEGDFHEALNVAAVWNLPVLFCIENNGYGLSTPTHEQYKCKDLADKGKGYGMESHIIDGNNILEVYTTVDRLCKKIRKNPAPILLEFKTFRMRGHEEASGTKYVPTELMEAWAEKDPIDNYEKFLLDEKLLDTAKIAKLKKEIETEINENLKLAFDENEVEVNESKEVDAISNGLRQSMKKHDNLVIMGQDVADYGGVFKITDGFVDDFGNPIVNYLAKSHYRWGEKADVVIRMPCGGDVGAGPFHSQTNEAWFTKTPGLKVAYPAFPADAKGLLNTSINDPNPVLFFEHKGLYRSIYQNVPTDYYTIPFGKASLLKEGNDISIVSYGAGVHWALATLEKHPELSADLIDLRTLAPLDIEAIYTSVKKTGKLIILQEDSLFGGIASDISSLVTENCFEALDGPIKRVASLETPIPFAKNLENNYLPKARFEVALLELLAY